MADSLAGASSTQPKPAYSRFAQEPSNADDAQPPAYNSLPPSSDPPPAYASLFPERVLHRLPAPIRPARPPTRHERHSSLIKCGVLLLLFAVQCAVIGLAAKGTQKFGRVFAPSAETDIGLYVRHSSPPKNTADLIGSCSWWPRSRKSALRSSLRPASTASAGAPATTFLLSSWHST